MIFPYDALKKIAIALLVFYFCMGIYERLVRHGGELYPFFSWYLFAAIPNPDPYAYDIQILSFDNVVYDPPLPFSKTRPLFVAIRQSPTEYSALIYEFGRALSHNDTAVISRERARVEQMFGGKPAVYEMLRVEYDPLNHWRDEGYASSSSLGVFESRI